MNPTNPDPSKARTPAEKIADPVGGLAPPRPGSPRADDHDVSGKPPAEVIRRGYEEDSYDSKSVLSVPLLVVGFFVLAFGTVTIMFRFMAPPDHDPNAHPMAVEQNSPSLNDRMARIHRGGEVDQPRLEPLRLRDERAGDARSITRPEKPVGNSPEIHPEDLRPSPDNTPGLYQTGWGDAGKTFARIPIDDAMALAAKGKLFPTAKDGTNPARSTNVPTAANAGRGAGLNTAVPPKLGAAGKDGKKDHHEEGKH